MGNEGKRNSLHRPGGRPAGRLWRRRFVFALALIVATGLSIAAWRGAQAFFHPDEEAPVRLHVVPHSDDPDEQRLKWAVRDALRPVAEEMMRNPRWASAGQERWRAFGEALRAAAEAELGRQGAGRPVAVVVEGDGGARPAALRVVIGDGRGANWFCVLVPPLCFADLEPVERPAPGRRGGPDEGGVRIGWKWLGRWLGSLTVPFERVGDVDQDDVHADFAHAAPGDGDVGAAGE